MENDEINKNGSVKELNDILAKLNDPKTITSANGGEFVFYPSYLNYINLDNVAEQKEKTPRCLTGNMKLSSCDSFIEYINRFKDADSVVLFDEEEATFKAVFDFDIGGENKSPRWKRHGAEYKAEISEESEFWKKYNEQWLNQMQFAAFLEKRCLDFFEASGDCLTDDIKRLQMLLSGKFATPAGMLELAKGITVNRGAKAKTIYNRSTGARSIAFEESDKDVDVPNLFMIAVPLFKQGALYRLPAQIRFKIEEGNIFWQYELHRYDESRKAATEEMAKKVKEETALPVFFV